MIEGAQAKQYDTSPIASLVVGNFISFLMSPIKRNLNWCSRYWSN